MDRTRALTDTRGPGQPSAEPAPESDSAAADGGTLAAPQPAISSTPEVEDRDPKHRSAPEGWAIVAMCTEPLQARAIEDRLRAQGYHPRRQIYDLLFGGPVVTLFVPDGDREAASRIAVSIPRASVMSGVSDGKAAEAASLLVAIDGVMTRLGVWIAERLDPVFRRQRAELWRARLERTRDSRPSTRSGRGE
jgi:hypothetical protein